MSIDKVREKRNNGTDESKTGVNSSNLLLSNCLAEKRSCQSILGVVEGDENHTTVEERKRGPSHGRDKKPNRMQHIEYDQHSGVAHI